MTTTTDDEHWIAAIRTRWPEYIDGPDHYPSINAVQRFIDAGRYRTIRLRNLALGLPAEPDLGPDEPDSPPDPLDDEETLDAMLDDLLGRPPLPGEVASTRAGRSATYLLLLVMAGVSIATNIGHTYLPPVGAGPAWSPSPWAVALAACWPIAVFLAVEVLLGVPASPSRWLRAAQRWGLAAGTVIVAAVSYDHLSTVMIHFHYREWIAYAGPLAIDGLMVVATVALTAIHTERHPAHTGGHHHHRNKE